MEIKTCEQYVLDRLKKAETDVESLEHILNIRDSVISALNEELTTLKDFVAKAIQIKSDTDGNKFISFESYWEKYDKAEYDFFSKLAPKDETSENQNT